MPAYEHLKRFFDRNKFQYEEHDNLFAFMVNNVNFLAFKNEGPFVQIVILCDTGGVSREKLLEGANEVNMSKFIVKITINQDSKGAWCSYEFCPDEHTPDDLYISIFKVLDDATEEFFSRLRS